jgi:hypothetical protein
MDKHSLWILFFSYPEATTLSQYNEMLKGVKDKTKLARELFDYACEVRQKRYQRQLQVKTVRQWLDVMWAKRNVGRIELPKKEGAGDLTCKVQAGPFVTDLKESRGGSYKGKFKGYAIWDKHIYITMPRNWNFINTKDYHVWNIALPNGKQEGICMHLERSRGYSFKWEKGYCFKGHYVPVKEWSTETENKVIANLVKNKLELAHA